MQNVFQARRRAFMDRIGPGAVAVIAGAQLQRRNSDVDHRFRQSSDMLYLTGFPEPDALCVIAPSSKTPFVLFVQPRDRDKEIWHGRRAGTEGAKARYGADEAFVIGELKERMPTLLDGAEEILFVPGDDRATDELVLDTLARLRQGERRGMRAPTRLGDLRVSLHEQRLYKDQPALDTLALAAKVTAEAHIAAMRAAKDGVFEYEIEALVDYTFRKSGGFPGYGTIVGGGANATILHYVDNNERLNKGDLLLIDAGCELDGFTADVTRTFPVAARFSDAQRRVYALVLDVEKRCIEATKPGATVDGIHQLAVERLTQGMVEIGLLKGDVKELIASGAFKRFYMHRTSHWLGLDVHDVGAYTVDKTPRPLAPGMVLTVEPGLYIAADDETVAPEYRGIGVRIEDDVYVTASGNQVLTAAVPKEIGDIEALTTA